MLSIVPHNSLKNVLICILLLGLSMAATSQNDEDPPPVSFDSIYSTTDSVTVSVTGNENSKFDSLSPALSPSYHPYSIPETKLDELRKDDAFWYANETPKRQKPPEIKPGKIPFFLQDWFRVLLWIVVIGSFLAVLIWFLVASDVRLFRKKPKPLQEEIDVALSEAITCRAIKKIRCFS